jgi:hypothetical protein
MRGSGSTWNGRLSRARAITGYMNVMPTWTSQELDRIGAAHEMRTVSVRRDGSLRDPVIVWVVRAGDEIYTRSVNGRDAAWFRATQVNHEGHIQAGGVDKDVTFVDVDGEINDQLDAAYRRKYGNSIGADHIVMPKARAATLKLIPR